MVETLEYLIQQAAEHPRHPRGALYRELLRSQTFLLCVGKPMENPDEVRVAKGPQDFAVWVDRDPELGGVWVPLFPASDDVERFVRTRRLRPPKGKDFLWLEHQPGDVFRLLRAVRHFSGMRLHVEPQTYVPVPWSLVKSLSAGRVPSDAPELYELPIERLAIPEGTSITYGRIPLGEAGQGKLLCLPAAGHFGAEDMRKLVKLDMGQHGVVWMACRHFLQVVRYLHSQDGGDKKRHSEDILRALMGFEMYGEAENLCEWLARKGEELFAWKCLVAVWLKIGRLSECVDFCRQAAAKYPQERSFWIHGARALLILEKVGEARAFAAEGLKALPGDKTLSKILQEAAGATGGTEDHEHHE